MNDDDDSSDEDYNPDDESRQRRRNYTDLQPAAWQSPLPLSRSEQPPSSSDCDNQLLICEFIEQQKRDSQASFKSFRTAPQSSQELFSDSEDQQEIPHINLPKN